MNDDDTERTKQLETNLFEEAFPWKEKIFSSIPPLPNEGFGFFPGLPNDLRSRLLHLSEGF